MFSLLSYQTPWISASIEDNSYSFELEQEITHEFENEFQARTQKQPILILIGGFQGSGKSSLITRIKKCMIPM